MNERIKNITVTILFLFIVFAVFFLNLLSKDSSVSLSERRKLKQLPKVTYESVFDGIFSKEFEKYAMDQFFARDSFRNIKTFVNFNVFKQEDANGLFIENDSIYKQTGKLNESEIKKATTKFNIIQEKFLKNNRVYFSIIPDKNYYLKNNMLRMDYEKLENIMVSNLSNMQYINLFSVLNENDYYKTDIHWKQENLIKVAELIAKSMNVNLDFKDIKVNSKGIFYGVYAGQLGLNRNLCDELKYITNKTIEGSNTFNLETNKTEKVYDEEKFKTSADKYDFFVSGATPLITIENPSCKNVKELIIFRDSFASSLAPLLLEEYSKITLVDIRYISTEYLQNYIEFNNKDILFLYNTLILNNASMFK